MRDLVGKMQDLRYLQWSENKATSGSGGTFLKASTGAGTGRAYYKLSCYDAYRGIYGHECVNELVASRLFGLLGFDHVPYSLIHASVLVDGVEYETWLSKSGSYRHSTERKQAFDTFCRLHGKTGELPLDIAGRYGWESRMRQMMLGDYLIANRDRHGANIEVLRDSDGSVRLAPLFDNGLSLVFSCYRDEACIAAFDPLDDVRANNFVGTRSLEENLRFVLEEPPAVRELEEGWEQIVLDGLGCCLTSAHLGKIREIIERRWKHYALLRDSRFAA